MYKNVEKSCILGYKHTIHEFNTKILTSQIWNFEQKNLKFIRTDQTETGIIVGVLMILTRYVRQLNVAL